MKRILYNLSVLALLSLFSCTSIDNYDEPDAQMTGNLIDQSTGKNFITSQNDFKIRIWEKSWSDSPQPQDIPVKQDGTFTDTKLFSGTYDMMPYGGPFWPIDAETGIKLSGALSKNFTVTPYLQITDATFNLIAGDSLQITCKLKAPVTQNLPRVLEVRPFVSLSQFCGASSRIDAYNDDKYTVGINANWSDDIGNTTYVLPKLPLLSGRTYYVRVGSRVQDTYQKYNYSDISKIVVP